MIIVVNIKPCEVIKMSDTEGRRLFEKITLASQKGYHRFIVDLELSKFISNCDHFSEKVRKHFEHLSENFVQNDSQLEQPNIVLNIKYGNDNIAPKESKVWFVGHRSVLKSNLLKPTQFLVESEETDAFVYKMMVNYLGEKIELNNLSFHIISGMGSATGIKIKKLICKKFIICCICDSDKSAPSGIFGDTYNIIDKSAKKLKFGKVFATPCRELENFFDLELVQMLLSEKEYKKKKQTIKKLNELMECEKCNNKLDYLWLFFDIKEGISGKKILQKEDKTVQEWIARKYNTDMKDLGNIKFPSICEETVERFKKNDKAHNEFVCLMGKKSWQKQFNWWIKSYIWYFCGSEPYNL